MYPVEIENFTTCSLYAKANVRMLYRLLAPAYFVRPAHHNMTWERGRYRLHLP